MKPEIAKMVAKMHFDIVIAKAEYTTPQARVIFCGNYSAGKSKMEWLHIESTFYTGDYDLQTALSVLEAIYEKA